MKNNYRAVAMRCTQEQFDSIKDRIPLPIISIGNFDEDNYLIIVGGNVTNIIEWEKSEYVSVVYETFDGELFLDCCGREKEGECKEKDYFVYVTQKQKDAIIKEYLKNKVWKGTELQYQRKNGDWVDCNDFDVRLKPQPDYSKEIEALENKAKENGQKVIIKIE